ncbi:MAG: helix-turn-helix domain-containing protein [Anaerolineales bacterium]
MQSTRQRILEYLDQRGSAGARQLAQAFRMTAANLRRHLGILQSRGLVQVIAQRPAAGRGRPEQVYALAPAANSADLERLTRALLADLSASPARGGRIKRLAFRLAGNQAAPGGQTTQRLVAAVQRLAPLGYKPRWEARPQGPQVVLGRCPYAAIIGDHPDLCQMDSHLLEELLGAPVEQTAKLQVGPQGLPQCVFKVKTGA